MVAEMFSSDYGTVSGKKVSFYGNDPVCMFKYFVLLDDPQFLFVWSYISLHFLCFVAVAVCHILIVVLTKKAAVPGADRRASNRLGHKVTCLCVTDFCSWIPFLICCALHTAEVADMSPWYQIFSLNILPINSVLNPLLYSDVLNKVFTTSNSWRSIFALVRGIPVVPEPADQIPASNSCQENTEDGIALAVLPADRPGEKFEMKTMHRRLKRKYRSCGDLMPTRGMIQETAFDSNKISYDHSSRRRNVSV